MIAASGVLTALQLPHGATAMEVEFAGRAVKREILVLYDRKQEGPPITTRVHRYAEMPLNHLGLSLTYQDVNKPLPDPGETGKYRGIITWFVEPLADPARVAVWLDKAMLTGVRYAVMGEVAPPESAERVPAIGRIFARLGLKESGDDVGLTYRARVVKSDRKFIGFERPLDKVLPNFPAILAASKSLRIHAAIKVPIEGVETVAVVVASNGNGGYAAQNFTFYYEKNTDRVRWILNPFAFFRAAFGIERFPIPDTTTLDGRRIYFSHIDGDGWNNLSEIEEYRRDGVLSAEVIERVAIRPYPDLPVSVGLLAGDVDLDLGGNPDGALIARRLFALPQVEVASHTHTHPYDWQFFRDYKRADEVILIDRYQRPDAPLRKQFTAAVLRLANKRVPADRFNKYVAGTDDLPRTYLKRPFRLKHEVSRALEVLRELAPKGKKPRLYQWSGDTTPFPAAIAATRAAGVRNINGGDSRFDWEFPSIAYVPSISRMTGGERQIYAVNSNENTYTNDWTGPYFGFFMLEHTLRNTERPRRLKGFNLYYHMYSGEKASALASIRYFLEKAKNSDVIPIAASHYAAIADDFFATRIEQIDLWSWAVKSRGAMQTMRFDDAENLRVDYGRSSGVIGATRHQGSLYIALDESQRRAVISLRPKAAGTVVEAAVAGGEQAAGGMTDAPAPAGSLATEAPSVIADRKIPRLESSRWHLSKVVEESCGITVDAQGFGPGDMTWRTTPGSGFLVSARRKDKIVSKEVRWADREGLLKLRIKGSAQQPLSLSFTCHE